MSGAVRTGKERLSIIDAWYHVCANCGVVDQEHARSWVGYECPSCGAASEGSMSYFRTAVRSTVDLIQELYEAPAPEPITQPLVDDRPNRHHVAVVIFFCTLGEILIAHFMREMMSALDLPKNVIERLLQDNLYARSRTSRLFKSLAGVKWETAVKRVSEDLREDLKEAERFYRQTAETRNALVHEGHLWSMGRELPESCVGHIGPLVRLFVGLHNRYVVRALAANGRQHWTAALKPPGAADSPGHHAAHTAR